MRFITADIIFNGIAPLEEGSILVLKSDGSVEDLLPKNSIEKNRIEHLNGWISPGFINVHCHLELSHFLKHIPKHKGLIEFGKQIISLRPTFHPEAIKEAMIEADNFMVKEGVFACGDICNTTDSITIKENSSIFYHSFIELLALDPQRAEEVFRIGKNLFEQFHRSGLSCSLAPHAPYSVSLLLMEKIASFNILNKLPSTIHNQESEEENKFFRGERSSYQDLYDFLKMDISWFKAPGKNSLPGYLPSLNTQQTLLIHNTFTKFEDLIAVKGKNIFWGFCPKANLYINNCLPDYSIFNSFSDRICIGTDSLASNNSLSMIDELNVLLKNSTFTANEALQFITSNGAKAMLLPDHFGKITKGNYAGLNHLELSENQFKFIKRIN